MHRILITGGCGFIGSNLIEWLRTAGYDLEIRVLDNESLGRREHIGEFDVEFMPGELCDAAMLKRALKDVDAVVHLAADTRVMDAIADPRHNFGTNVVGTFELLMAMREVGVSRLVNASTGGAIIGEANPPVNEEMVPHPLSPYGASKLATEGYCSSFVGAFGFHAVSLRFSNVYGPRSFHKGSVVAHFFKRLLAGKPLIVYGDGQQTRDYVFVKDLCDGIVKALYSAKSGVIQLGTGTATSLNELIATIRRIVGSDVEVKVRYEDFRPGEVRQTWCDITKARREIGYNPTTPLETGLALTWQWFQSMNVKGLI